MRKHDFYWRALKPKVGVTNTLLRKWSKSGRYGEKIKQIMTLNNIDIF
jgi:hypothetical protein